MIKCRLCGKKDTLNEYGLCFDCVREKMVECQLHHPTSRVKHEAAGKRKPSGGELIGLMIITLKAWEAENECTCDGSWQGHCLYCETVNVISYLK